ncbi:hypothetical protein [Roseibium sp. MMSF_3412]|uniref:hypothetical protein n=1 Tax=Roseibium sp. MMSF_3412 TaxID=3046712 RepID=UPI00273F10D2|nr:hypothetical protein [Roseibium sp. MMSF_3412]
MSKRKRKVAALINRIQFIDLASAVVLPASSRKDWLRRYVERAMKGGDFATYKPLRNAYPTIYGVQRGLDVSPKVEWGELERSLVQACKGKDEEMNVSAAKVLFDLVRAKDYLAYDHTPQDLSLGLNRKAAIGISIYLVEGEEVVFQFPYPRRNRLDAAVNNLMMSLIYHSYARGDFAGAAVEIADLSCATSTYIKGKDGTRRPPPRDPRIVRLEQDNLIQLDDLTPHVQNVHELLIEIGTEPDPT